MKILLNNREQEFADEVISVEEMLNLMKYSFKLRIIKINGNLVPRDNYNSTMIREGDNVQMIYLMSGG
jgi:sulfur carrier protein